MLCGIGITHLRKNSMVVSLTTSVNGTTYKYSSPDFLTNDEATVTSTSTVANTDLSNDSKTLITLGGLLIKKKRGANFTKPKKRRRK